MDVSIKISRICHRTTSTRLDISCLSLSLSDWPAACLDILNFWRLDDLSKLDSFGSTCCAIFSKNSHESRLAIRAALMARGFSEASSVAQLEH